MSAGLAAPLPSGQLLPFRESCLAWLVPPVRIGHPQTALTPGRQPPVDALPPRRSALQSHHRIFLLHSVSVDI